jgi:anti-sigma factor RsiW
MSTLSRETMLDLMQYADGELDGDARARVEELLATSAEARGVVEAMGTLGDIVRHGVEERASASAAADAIADSVMAGIAREAPAQVAREHAPRAQVVPLARPARLSRPVVASAVISVLALAAGVVLFVRSEGSSRSAKGYYAAAAAPSDEAEDAPSDGPEALAQTEPLGVDLEEVRSIRNKVDVFFVPSEKSVGASVVVWIDDRHGEH